MIASASDPGMAIGAAASRRGPPPGFALLIACLLLLDTTRSIDFDCADERFEFGTCMTLAGMDTQSECQSCTYESFPDVYESDVEDCDSFQDGVCGTLAASGCGDVCGWSAACLDNYNSWLNCAVTDHPRECRLLPCGETGTENSTPTASTGGEPFAAAQSPSEAPDECRAATRRLHADNPSLSTALSSIEEDLSALFGEFTGCSTTANLTVTCFVDYESLQSVSQYETNCREGTFLSFLHFCYVSVVEPL